MTGRRLRSGFSLIEALVALTIAAMIMMAVFELQSQMVRSQERAARAIDQVAAQENALALLRQLNPMEQPEGQLELPDGDVIAWRAEPKGQPVVNTNRLGGGGAFEVQLFSMTVIIESEKQRSIPPLIFDRIGWRRLEGFDDNIFD